nr:hypothetical protein [Tanacetum cinerariifolium]
MATTIEQQTALDESLVPSPQRLRIGRCNFRLPSDIQSKEATLQVVYDVLRNSPLFRAFQVTADVPEIYMQEFWATAKLHHTSIRFKIDTKKSVLNLEAFREMLHVSPRIPNQPFADLPTEEEVLDFLRFLGHSQDIRYLTDVNVNKLYQPWRSFASVINKCLTGKSSGVDSFRLSQAQMLWGLYNRINIDFAYLIWEDFVGDDSLVMATTIATSLEVEHDSGNIDKTQTKATSIEPSFQGTSSGDGPRLQDTIENTSAHTRVISTSDDEALDKEDTSKQGRIDEIDVDEDIALNIIQDKGIKDVGEEEVVDVVTTAKMIIDAAQVTTAIADILVSAAETIVTTALTITAESIKINVEVTQAPKRKGVLIQEPKETTTTKTTSLQQPPIQEKGKWKAKLIEEPKMPKKRKHQIRADEKLSEKLQAEIDEEDMLERERAQKEQEANDALINNGMIFKPRLMQMLN